MRRAFSMAAPTDAPALAGSLGCVQQIVLADLGRVGERSATGRRGIFQPPPRGTLEDRWAIYTSGYLARLVETIGHDYKAVRRVVGESSWRSLIARYLRACPPREHDIAREGRRLPEFLANDPLAAELPFLSDLARLELAMAIAFIAPDHAKLSWWGFVALGVEAASLERLRAVPGASVLRSAWPLSELRRLAEVHDRDVDVRIEGRAEAVLVWRRGWTATTRAVYPAEAAIAEAVIRGASLSELTGVNGPGHGEDPAVIIVTIRRLIEDGVIAALARGFHKGEPGP